MADVEHDGGGSGAAVVGIFAIALIVIVLLLFFAVHPFRVLSPPVVAPTGSAGGAGPTMQATASSAPSLMASPSK